MSKTTNEAWTGKKSELSPEAMKKRKAINKKILKFGCLPILLIAIIIAIIPKGGSDDKKNSEGQSGIAENISIISGITPVDVYLNLEKQGFKTKKQLGGEYGNSWTSTQSYDGMDITVETFSYNTNSVASVQASVMVDVSYKDIIAGKQFMKYISSLPYKNSKPEDAIKWVDENYDADKASTEIGDVKFTIYAPSAAVRMLMIEPAE